MRHPAGTTPTRPSPPGACWRRAQVPILSVVLCLAVAVAQQRATASSCDDHLYDDLTLVRSSGDASAARFLEDVKSMYLEQYELTQEASLCLGVVDTEAGTCILVKPPDAPRTAWTRRSTPARGLPSISAGLGCVHACDPPFDDFPIGEWGLPQTLLAERALESGSIRVEATTATIEVASSSGTAEGEYVRTRRYR